MQKLKVKIFQANEKQVDVASLISDNKDCDVKNIVRDKEGYHIIIKGTFSKKNSSY